jgi:hypothetical protein
MKDKLIEIGVTNLLPERANRLDDIESTFQLFENYITEIIVRPNRESFLVDTFRFFYETLSLMTRFHHQNEFSLPVGEGLEIDGHVIRYAADMFEVRIGAFDMSRVYAVRTMSRSLMLYQLVVILCDIDKSASLVGIDAGECLKKFPPEPFYHR